MFLARFARTPGRHAACTSVSAEASSPMKSFSEKRVLSPSLFFLALGALIHCGGNDDMSFTTQGDTAVMSGIVGTWTGTSSAGNTYTLTLCENTSSNLSTNETCQTLHTVRGQGRGTTETVKQPGGCG